jgi:four helix bundle protein
MNANELQARTFKFALAILALCDLYPHTVQGRTVVAQLAKAGTSVGANYRAARRSRSPREFASNIGVVKEEADETEYWLELSLAAGLVSDRARAAAAYQEARELRAIFVSAHATARKRVRARKRTKILRSLDP